MALGEIRKKLHDTIFEADTPTGKRFDVILLVLILLSVLIVALETVPYYQEQYGRYLVIAEWVFTILFTIEYIVRLSVVKRPWHYAKSFYGVVDLLSIIPTYLTLLMIGSKSLIIIRALRLLRVFRIFKMGHHLSQAQIIVDSLRMSIPKITVFLYFILLMVSVFGSVMYLIEGGSNPSFDSIPRSIYWAIVTLTTVGFGDITPQTSLGQFLSAILMVMGYAVIAVPTGIVSAELVSNMDSHPDQVSTKFCSNCSTEGHDRRANFCKYCGQAFEK